MQVVLIGKAVLYETTEISLRQKWNVLKFKTLSEFLEQLSEGVDDYALWIHFDSEISDSAFLGKKAPSILLTTTTGVTHISASVYAEYEKTNSMISLKGEVDFLRKITSTAEHAWTLMLMLTSRLPMVISDTELKTYQREFFYKLKQVSEMTIGIIGCGRLGGITYQYARAFGLGIQMYDLDAKKYESNSIRDGDVAQNLETLVSSSEIIMLHADSSVGARPILGPKEFDLMNQGTYIVNTSRANLVHGPSLISKLEEGSLGGYAADVQFAEDLGGDPAFDLKIEQLRKSGSNILVTPHVGGGAGSAILQCETFLVEKLNALSKRRLESAK